jgi:L-alanine-DL-glutamate epimerase-like enolase superfamily enzyme
MRIDNVQGWMIEAPIAQRYEMSGGTHDAARCLVVRIETDDGAYGFGEAHQGVGGYSSETTGTMAELLSEVYGPAVVGCESNRVASLMDHLHKMRSGNFFVKSAIDMALFDLLGRQLDVPLGVLFGGAERSTVGLIAGIGLDNPEAASSKALGFMEAGFRTIKLKVGDREVKDDIERVRAVRRGLGDEPSIRVDANGAYSLPEAVRLARGIEEFDIELLEQPLARWDVSGMAELRRRTIIPLMADESVETAYDVVRIGRESAADIVKIKIAKVGGILPSVQIIGVAESFGIGVIVGHGMSIGVQAVAEANLIAMDSHVNVVGEMVGPSRLVDPLVKDLPDFSSPSIDIPKGPGLGVSVDEAMLEKYGSRVFASRSQ